MTEENLPTTISSLGVKDEKKVVASTVSNSPATPNTSSAHAFSQPIVSACLPLGLSPNLVGVLERDSSSKKTQASELVREVFTKEERISSNVNGLKGKTRLDPNKMELVKSLTFVLRPAKPGENGEEVWRKECVKAIDASNRTSKI